MTTYAALLRGINLGSTNKVPMGELRSLFEREGFENVRTYVQSGNVVFEAKGTGTSKIAITLEKAISTGFGLDIAVLLRNRSEMKRVSENNPFAKKRTEPRTLHVMFLADRPPASKIANLDHDRSPSDEFEVNGREIYLWYPNGAGRSKLTLRYFEKSLGTKGTARNWNTVTKLVQMMESS